jgi:hypothetical protein
MTKGFLTGMLVAAAIWTVAQPATAGKIERRKHRQQKRIEQGEKSGRLSPAEAERLEKQEGAINREEQAMKDANGGHLTAAERRDINRQQNRTSRRIYKQKHDANNK